MGSGTTTRAGEGGARARGTGAKNGASRASRGRASTKSKRAPGRADGRANNGGERVNGRSHRSTAHPAIPPPLGPESDRLAPVKPRPTRSERAFAEARAREVDEVCAAWAAIVAERMAADQAFAEAFERFRCGSRDLRALFELDALHASETHVALLNSVIARHLDGRRADPLAILTDVRQEQRKLAVAYAVNAFLAVLNQMSPNKPKWIAFEDFDPRIAVLALAHQTLEYAIEAARIEAPPDMTEHILRAAQDDSVWTGARNASDRTLAACAAAAVFFRSLGSSDLGSIDEVITLYEHRASARAAACTAR